MIVEIMSPIVASIVFSLVLILILVTVLLVAKAKLLPSGKVKIINQRKKEIEVETGSTLLTTLGNEKIFLPSACGGGGTCLQCECHVLKGGGEALPTEVPNFTRKELLLVPFGLSGESERRYGNHNSGRNFWYQEV